MRLATVSIGTGVLLSLAAACLSALVPLPVIADDGSQAGRDIAAKWAEAVVTVQLVIKTQMSMGEEEGMKQESKADATAVIIDPSGLAVASLAATDPSEAINRMMGTEQYAFKFSTEVADVKIRLADGQELPAKIVLRDKDLDLAFVRPTVKPAKPLLALDLAKQAKPVLLDQTVVLSRLGRVASRALATCLDRIQATVEKPRIFYVPGAGAMGSELGAPVFATDGNLIGLLVLRTLPERAGGFTASMGSMLGGLGDMGVLPIILPASDVLAAAKQAPEAAQ